MGDGGEEEESGVVFSIARLFCPASFTLPKNLRRGKHALYTCYVVELCKVDDAGGGRGAKE
jgi:hypothetical protein